VLIINHEKSKLKVFGRGLETASYFHILSVVADNTARLDCIVLKP